MSTTNITALDPTVSTEDRGPMINVVIWVITFTATTFLGLRVYCKLSRRNKLWWDDHFLIASWGCLVLSNTVTSANVALGFGRATSTIDPDALPTLGLLRLVNASLSIVGVIWSKTSFGVTLLRLVAGSGKTKRFVLFLLVTSNLFFGASVAFSWLQCTPINKNWIPSQPGSCLNPLVRIRFNMVGGVYSGVMDMVLALLPWPILKGLTMKKREKLGVGFAMSMGMLAGVAAFIKTSKIQSSGATDFNLEGYPIILWSTAEIGITIIAASIPTLRVLIRDVASTIIYARSRTYRSQHNDGDDGYDFRDFSRADNGSNEFPAPLKKVKTWKTTAATDLADFDDTVQLHPTKSGGQSHVTIHEINPGANAPRGKDGSSYDRRTGPSATWM